MMISISKLNLAFITFLLPPDTVKILRGVWSVVTDQWGWLCRDERDRERDSHHETSRKDALRPEGGL